MKLLERGHEHPADAGTQHTVGACPHDCPDTCSLVTTVANGVALKVQGNPAHPHTDGVLCTKVSRYTERTYHPERLLHPLKRVGPKGSGQFEQVSWDAALADIAARLDRDAALASCAAKVTIIDNSGPLDQATAAFLAAIGRVPS